MTFGASEDVWGSLATWVGFFDHMTQFTRPWFNDNDVSQLSTAQFLSDQEIGGASLNFQPRRHNDAQPMMTDT